jgi:hypothetical protein
MRRALPVRDGQEGTMRHVRLIALLTLPLVFASGCAVFVDLVTDPLGRKTALKRDQRDYTKYVRWGDIEGAAHFVHPDVRAAFLHLADDFEGIRVTDFEVGDVTYSDGESVARVRVTYTAYSLHSMIEKEIREVQEWERIGPGNQWFVRPKLEGLVEQVADLR